MRHEPLSDEALDRELSALVNVESPRHLLARVRTRVADEARASRTSGWRLLVAGATIVIAIVAVAIFWPHEHVPQVSVSGKSEPTMVKENSDTHSRISERRIDSVRPTQRVSAARPTRREHRAEPEVLISPAEAAGMQQFMAAIAAGRISADDLPAEITESEMPIAIAPLVVAPLAIAGNVKGDVAP